MYPSCAEGVIAAFECFAALYLIMMMHKSIKTESTMIAAALTVPATISVGNDAVGAMDGEMWVAGGVMGEMGVVDRVVGGVMGVATVWRGKCIE